jgi:hypothetical protein
MSKHGIQYDRRCPWCFRLFASRQGVQAHAMAKHPRNLPRTEDERQRAAMQTLHQDMLRRPS